MNPGRFDLKIEISGPLGSGKTCLATQLKRFIESLGATVTIPDREEAVTVRWLEERMDGWAEKPMAGTRVELATRLTD